MLENIDVTFESFSNLDDAIDQVMQNLLISLPDRDLRSVPEISWNLGDADALSSSSKSSIISVDAEIECNRFSTAGILHGREPTPLRSGSIGIDMYDIHCFGTSGHSLAFTGHDNCSFMIDADNKDAGSDSSFSGNISTGASDNISLSSSSWTSSHDSGFTCSDAFEEENDSTPPEDGKKDEFNVQITGLDLTLPLSSFAVKRETIPSIEEEDDNNNRNSDGDDKNERPALEVRPKILMQMQNSLRNDRRYLYAVREERDGDDEREGGANMWQATIFNPPQIFSPIQAEISSDDKSSINAVEEKYVDSAGNDIGCQVECEHESNSATTKRVIRSKRMLKKQSSPIKKAQQKATNAENTDNKEGIEAETGRKDFQAASESSPEIHLLLPTDLPRRQSSRRKKEVNATRVFEVSSVQKVHNESETNALSFDHNALPFRREKKIKSKRKKNNRTITSESLSQRSIPESAPSKNGFQPKKILQKVRDATVEMVASVAEDIVIRPTPNTSKHTHQNMKRMKVHQRSRKDAAARKRALRRREQHQQLVRSIKSESGMDVEDMWRLKDLSEQEQARLAIERHVARCFRGLSSEGQQSRAYCDEHHYRSVCSSQSIPTLQLSRDSHQHGFSNYSREGRQEPAISWNDLESAIEAGCRRSIVDMHEQHIALNLAEFSRLNNVVDYCHSDISPRTGRRKQGPVSWDDLEDAIQEGRDRSMRDYISKVAEKQHQELIGSNQGKSEPWQCVNCTLVNKLRSCLLCGACNQPRT